MAGSAIGSLPAQAVPMVLGLMVIVACTRPLDRPLEGAPARPGSAANLGLTEPPPTLAVPGAPPAASPALLMLAASPIPSPTAAGRNPILSGLAPAPDAQIPPGAVSIGARISASSELSEVAVILDGATVQPRITTFDAKNWGIAYTSKLEAGKHEVHLNAKDSDGRAGGYRWQFEVEGPVQALPTTPPLPAPTASGPVAGTQAGRALATRTPEPRR